MVMYSQHQNHSVHRASISILIWINWLLFFIIKYEVFFMYVFQQSFSMVVYLENRETID